MNVQGSIKGSNGALLLEDLGHHLQLTLIENGKDIDEGFVVSARTLHCVIEPIRPIMKGFGHCQ